MRRTFCGLIFGLITLSTLAANTPRTAAQAGDPGSLIAEVNGLGTARGLAPYRVNNALMAAAQAHSEYQAKAGSATHKPPTASPTAGAATPAALALTTATAQPDSQGIVPQGALVQAKSGPDYLLVVIVVLALSGLILILVGSVLKRST